MRSVPRDQLFHYYLSLPQGKWFFLSFAVVLFGFDLLTTSSAYQIETVEKLIIDALRACDMSGLHRPTLNDKVIDSTHYDSIQSIVRFAFAFLQWETQ